MTTEGAERLSLYCSAIELRKRTRDSSDLAGHWSVDGHIRRVNVAVVDTGFDRSGILLAYTLVGGLGFEARIVADLDGRKIFEIVPVGSTDEELVTKLVYDERYQSYYFSTKKTHHGTHVAGIVAMVVGDKCKDTYIVLCAIGDKGLGMLQALQQLADKSYDNVKVVNISWSFDFKSDETQNALLALTAKGKLVVISAGNGDKKGVGLDMSNLEHQNLRALLGIALNERAQGRLIIVGSTEAYTRRTFSWNRTTGRPDCEVKPRRLSEAYLARPGQFLGCTQSAPDAYAGEGIASYSNYPGEWPLAKSVFICAPGSDVLSAVPPDDQLDQVGVDVNSGTSMAAPVVTGLLAKALICFPLLSVDEVRKLLFQTADREQLYSKEQAPRPAATRAYDERSLGGYAAFTSLPAKSGPATADAPECGVGLVNADAFRQAAAKLSETRRLELNEIMKLLSDLKGVTVDSLRQAQYQNLVRYVVSNYFWILQRAEHFLALGVLSQADFDALSPRIGRALEAGQSGQPAGRRPTQP